MAGCGPASQLKLDLRAVSITVPRLVTPAIVLVPPAAAPQPVALPPLPPIITLLPPPPAEVPAQAPVVAPPPAPPACPAAGPLDTPAKPATPEVPHPPVPGTFVQASSGSFAGAPGTPSAGSLAGEVTVVVKALPSATSSVGQLVESWQVERTDPLRKSRSVEVYQLVHPSASVSATAPGIYLVGLAWSDPTRGDVTFQPTGGGIEILPVPVQVANNDTQYAGAATDPSTLTTLEITRNIRARKRVDACGKLIDTYTVEMTGALTTTSTQQQVAWTQQLATSYGAADVQETLSLTSVAGGSSWNRTLRNTTLPAEPK